MLQTFIVIFFLSRSSPNNNKKYATNKEKKLSLSHSLSHLLVFFIAKQSKFYLVICRLKIIRLNHREESIKWKNFSQETPQEEKKSWKRCFWSEMINIFHTFTVCSTQTSSSLKNYKKKSFSFIRYVKKVCLCCLFVTMHLIY